VQSLNAYPPEIPGFSEERVYKKVDDLELKIWTYKPKKEVEGKAPAVLFFFGGGWNKGSPRQFIAQCNYLAERGVYGILAD
jgi:acetyl esterase/lipase